MISELNKNTVGMILLFEEIIDDGYIPPIDYYVEDGVIKYENSERFLER